jgi:hypothetical protein
MDSRVNNNTQHANNDQDDAFKFQRRDSRLKIGASFILFLIGQI